MDAIRLCIGYLRVISETCGGERNSVAICGGSFYMHLHVIGDVYILLCLVCPLIQGANQLHIIMYRDGENNLNFLSHFIWKNLSNIQKFRKSYL